MTGHGLVTTAINGAAGRMGRLLLAGVLEHEHLALVAATDRPGRPDQGLDIGQLCGLWTTSVRLAAPAPGAYVHARVIVDFSLPEGTAAMLDHAEGKALVVGTTGLDAALRARLREHARTAPVVVASNFSTGVNVLLGLAARAAALLPDHDVEIVEMHHGRKRDAPSGTALALGQAVATARGQVLEGLAVHGRKGETGARPPHEIGFHALRGGDIYGEHTVYLAGPGERLVVGHLATSRDAFASGALRAASWVVEQPPGLYDMQDVLGLR